MNWFRSNWWKGDWSASNWFAGPAVVPPTPPQPVGTGEARSRKRLDDDEATLLAVLFFGEDP